MTDSAGSRTSDCWGRLNDVADISPVLTVLDSLPGGFRAARRALFSHLGLTDRSRVLEAGSGPGTALPDLLEWVGPDGRIVGIDPTRALVAQAQDRARAAGATHVAYDIGDIRAIAAPDHAFDAAFCDKILTHVAPVSAAIAELVRVTRPGGRVGAVEWYAQGMVIAADYAATRRILDGSAPLAALNPTVPLELEDLLVRGGLVDVESGTIVTESREYPPSLKMMLQRRVQQAQELGAVTTDAGTAWLDALEMRAARGTFYWAALVRWAAGTKR